MTTTPYIISCAQLAPTEYPLVGGKSATCSQLVQLGDELHIPVPDGFCVTTAAYEALLATDALRERLTALLDKVSGKISDITTLSEQMRSEVMRTQIPDRLATEIRVAYGVLSGASQECPVAVRSSATAEDAPDASFAGQHDSFVYIAGADQVVVAWQRVVASLFTARAIMYRLEHGFGQLAVQMGVLVQRMIASDQATAGVLFTMDPDSGHPDLCVINAVYGLGELLVQGTVTPDEYVTHQPLVKKGFAAVVRRVRGEQVCALRREHDQLVQKPVVLELQHQFKLSTEQIIELTRFGMAIAAHYGRPMDIEWAQDGAGGPLCVVQARPVTGRMRTAPVAAASGEVSVASVNPPPILVHGQGIGTGVVSGRIYRADSLPQAADVPDDAILVTRMTAPDWLPVLRKVRGMVTEVGGRTCHAAIVSREMGIPAIIGAERATQLLKTGTEVTVDAQAGMVYAGLMQGRGGAQFFGWTGSVHRAPIAQYMLNLSDSSRAPYLSALPVSGVGLVRFEFIMAQLGVHPLAVVAGTASLAAAEYIRLCVEQIGLIAASFYPRQVIVRLSDLKSNEYRALAGGDQYEPLEENPMMGVRGASRYVTDWYRPAFQLECRIMHEVRSVIGCDNVAVMVPFVRSDDELGQVIELMAQYGLVRGEHGLEVVSMIELPAACAQLELLAKRVDGFSIGSNDLTQFVFGIDRDAAHWNIDERHPVMRELLRDIITRARQVNKKIGICGQAPSDFDDVREFLLECGISYVSLNPDKAIALTSKLS